MLERRVHQCATRRRIEPFDRRLERHRPQPELVEGPGRADRLRAQQPAAAGDRFAGRHRRRLCVYDGDQAGSGGQPAGQRCQADVAIRRRRIAGQQGARPQDPVAVGARPREHHLGRRSKQAGMHAAGEVEFDLGAGMGAAGSALGLGSEQRIRPRRRRPAVVVEAHHPEAVEGQARALEHAEDLDRRLAAGFRLEHAIPAELAQTGEGGALADLAEQLVEPAEAVEDFAEGPVRLEFVARQRSLAGPAEGRQRRPQVPPPVARRLAARRAGQALAAGRQRRQRHRAGIAETRRQPRQRRRRRQVGQFAAHRCVEQRPAIGLVGIGTPEAGEQQCRQAPLFDPAATAGQRQQVEGAANQRLLGERPAERDVERPRQLRRIRADGRRQQDVVEQRRQPVADTGQVGRDDRQTQAGIGGQPALRPGNGGAAFDGGIGAGENGRNLTVDRRIRPFFNHRAAAFEGRQQAPLERRRPIEAGDPDQARKHEMAGLDQLDQAPLQAAGVDPPEPAAALQEALLPGGEQARLVGAAAGAERPLPAQRVSIHRRGGQPGQVEQGSGIAGAAGQVLGDHLLPEQALGVAVERRRQRLDAAEQGLVGQRRQPLADRQRPPRWPAPRPGRHLAAQRLGQAAGGTEQE